MHPISQKSITRSNVYNKPAQMEIMLHMYVFLLICTLFPFLINLGLGIANRFLFINILF